MEIYPLTIITVTANRGSEKNKRKTMKKKYCEWDGKKYGSHVHDDGMAPDIQCEKNKKKFCSAKWCIYS